MAQDDDWTIGDIKFTGLVDGYYQFNNNHPASGFTTLRNFDVGANAFNLNMVELSASHDADPIGFRIDLGWGRAWEIFNSFDSTTLSDKMRYVQQAYVTVAPEGWGGFTFDFGKFYTSAGAELTENNFTWTYGRGWIYTNGPYYHMGARIGKTFGDHVALGFQLVNGWNNVEDNNSGKTMGFTAAFTGEKASWYNTYYTGPEKAGTNDGWRHFYDTVINLNPSDKFGAYINFDYGVEKGIASTPDQKWWVIGFALHPQITEHSSLTFRYEYYKDEDGFITGTSRNLQSFTGTYEYKWSKGLLTRLEYRRDTSDVAFFETSGAFPSKHQDTLTLGFVAYFGK